MTTIVCCCCFFISIMITSKSVLKGSSDHIDLSDLPDLYKDLKGGDGDIICSKAKKINVLLIGKSQVGKSMIIKNLCNPRYGQSIRTYADTSNPNSYEILLTDKKTNNLISMTIIDTPGLYDERLKKLEIKDNQEILQLITKCVELNITYFHMIGLVYNIASNITPLDLNAFQIFTKFLGDKFKPISMLIFTHADAMKDDRLLEIIDELKSGEKTKEMFDYCSLGYQLLASLNKDQIATLEDDNMEKAIAEKHLIRIELMRKSFANALFDLEEKVYVDQIQQIVLEKETKIKKIQEETKKNK